MRKIEKIKVLAMTGTRADYPRIRDVLLYLKKKQNIDLTIGCTAQHLEIDSGFTYFDVFKDFKKKALPYQMYCGYGDTPIEKSRASMFSGYGFANLISEVKPDIILLTVDRTETLAAACAASITGIPIIHFQGGEESGTVDEMIRHAVSKLSHIHFVSNDEAKSILISLGENPNSIYVVGCPYVDYLYKFKIFSKKRLSKILGLNPIKKWIPFIFHPVTTEYNSVKYQINSIIKFLKTLTTKEYEIIIFTPNMDSGNSLINFSISKNFNFINTSLEPNLFLSLLKYSYIMIGNSSSGIREAPYFGLPVLNIGSRQQNRVRGNNVVDVNCNFQSLVKGFEKIKIDKSLRNKSEPYGSIGAIKRISDILNFLFEDLNSIQIQKKVWKN